MKHTQKTKSITCSIVSTGIVMPVNTIDEIISPGYYKVDACGVTADDGFPEEVDVSCISAYLEVNDTNHISDNLKSAAVGQTLFYTNASGGSAAYHRSGINRNGRVEWSCWTDIGAATTTDIQDGAITAQKLSADVRAQIYNNTAAISAERTRAMGQEGLLNDALEVEKQRALKAEYDAAEDGMHQALRALFVAAGAEYNGSGTDVTKTTPWGEPVIHKAGHYCLNGLGDITEEQMLDIYNAGELKNNLVGFYAYNDKIRTFIPSKISGQEGYGTISLSGILSGAALVESVVFTVRDNLVERLGVLFTSGTAYSSFNGCSNLVYIQKMNLSNITSLTSFFDKCSSLVSVKIINLKCNLDWAYSVAISKESVLYTIQNAAPTSAMTVTLHPDAYSRLADDTDIVSALEAQPLISLVSA